MDMNMGNGSSLPESHEKQVELGMQIVNNAYNGKVQAQQQELQGLKVSSEELKSQAATLQKKNGTLEAELQESQARVSQLGDENKDLFKTVQQLRKKLARLDVLKSRVMESITSAVDEEEIEDNTSTYA